MTIRSQGRKKSLFPGHTGIPAGTIFDFVSGGVNYKIPIADLLTALNVTGSIEQDGDPLAVPVLDVQASQHFIRNLEMSTSSGLKGSVSAQNGITLSLDAHADGSGTPVLNAANHVRRILAGGGIDVQLVDDDITISTTGSGPALATGIIAFAGGGQANAVELARNFNQVSVVASAGDSVKFPSAAANIVRTIINAGANALSLYPATGDAIDGQAVDLPVNIGSNGTATFYCYDTTNWVQI